MIAAALGRADGRSNRFEALGALGISLGVASVAARNGSYFPTSWGWAVLVFGWMAVVGLVLIGDAFVASVDAGFLITFGGFAGWTWLSTIWSDSVPDTVLEGQRVLIYVTALLLLIVLGRRIGTAPLLAGTLAGILVISMYALASRLFPGRIGSFDPIATYRLAAPIGYWNGLGLFAAVGSLLAAAFVARGRFLAARIGAAVALVVLVPTIYFTFSRGAWLALGLGLVVLVAIDIRRLQVICSLGITAIAPAIAVGVASRSSALTTQGAPLATASHQGHRLAGVVVALMVAAALLVGAFVAVERRWIPGSSSRRAFAGLLTVAAVVAVVAAITAWGTPWHVAARGWSAFTSTPPVTTTGQSFNNRLFNLSNNGRIAGWKVAVHEFERAPVLGTGSGTFESWWLARRPTPQQIRDAHSLYLETLAELGVVGLVLLVAALTVALAAGVRRRAEPLVPFAVAAFVAWIVHAAVDWDWEIPAVTLAALACGAALVCGEGRRRRGLGVSARAGIATAAAAIAIFGLVTAIGNGAIASSHDALDAHNFALAETEAKKAVRWVPWSADPLIVRGQIQALNQDAAGARADFRKAIAKDPRNYLAWYSLAGVTRGQARAEAVRKVLELNPLSDEAKELSKSP